MPRLKDMQQLGEGGLNTSESKGSIQQSTVGLGIPSSQGSLIENRHHSNGAQNFGKNVAAIWTDVNYFSMALLKLSSGQLDTRQFLIGRRLHF